MKSTSQFFNVANIIKLVILIILLQFSFSIGKTLNPDLPYLEYKKIVPAAEYRAGWLHRLFFGDHWRDLWTAEINVPVVDLTRFAGGLTPIKTGGGFQTKSLHFKGSDGKYYKFRSINKDPSKVLPEELQETFVSSVLQDQISTSHPLSAIIVAPMLNAVGVLNSEPVVVILPDDERLGKYRDEYKNLLGTLAENPKDDTEPGLIFAGADRVENDYKIFEELDEDDDDQVDAKEYLKARLMDVFLGDWDRHVGQWKWARFREGDKKIWKPIPRDRDQAFARYDGIFPGIAARAVPQIENFTESYPQVNDITWSGRHLDRRFLTSVNKTEWDSITSYVQSHLTDDIIKNAVNRMPETWVKKSGDYLIRSLKERRDKLPEISAEFYEMLAGYVDIKTSDKNEYARINRIDNNSVSVEIYKRDKKTGGPKGDPFYSRIFYTGETNEIRLYLQDGDDKAVVTGNVDESILLRIIGGEGKDELVDSSNVNGYFLSVTPIPDAENLTLFYDSGKKSNFVLASGTEIDQSKEPELKPYVEGDNVNEKYEMPYNDWEYDWKPGQWFGYNSDDGLQIGGGPILIRHAFRADPLLWKMSLMFAYATEPSSYRIEFFGEFLKLIKNWRVETRLGKNELAHNHFYGLGNELDLIKDVDDNYYRISQEYIYFDYLMDRAIAHNLRLQFTATVNRSNLLQDSNTIIGTEDFKGIGRNHYISVGTGLVYDSRDDQNLPTEGLFFKTEGKYIPAILDNKSDYSKASLDGRFFYTPQLLPVTLASRIYGENIWGNYYVYDAAKLGGSENLLGFSRERFSGDASVMAQSELRFPVAKLKIIIPGVLGFSAHSGTGRVFYSSDNQSDKWHGYYGGGIWVSYLKNSIMLNGIVSQSVEGTQIYFKTGFLF
ncbi:MAG: BamA/TamA family outer membrane protein [Calditrichaeota bacterium]|nr:BamA/TamA family outer membrane protein [Calditrichota bacterium]